MIHLYYGDGKGKTTAAFGLALRALSAGKHVCIVQFLKDGSSGEARALKSLPHVELLSDGLLAKFTFLMNEDERRVSLDLHNKNLKQAVDLVNSGGDWLLVLDEALDAVSVGLLDIPAFKTAVELGNNQNTEVVVTGHKASVPDAEQKEPVDHKPSDEPLDYLGLFAWLTESAHYITCFSCEKHPYQQGVSAREGIEF